MESQRPNRTFLWAWLLGCLPLVGWWTYGLFDLDEGFYGAITAEMNRRHEWITPFYNGLPWFEKPVLLYWVSKPFLYLCGDMVGPRMGSVLTSVALIGLVGWFTRRRAGEVAAAIAMVLQGTLLLSAVLGRMMMTDTLLSASLAACFLTFYESLVSDKRWRIASAGFLGLSVLAKGPVGCLLFVLVLSFTFLFLSSTRPTGGEGAADQNDVNANAFKGHWLAGTALFLLVISTWYVPAYLINRDLFVQKFLIEQNLNRFTGGDSAHTLTGIIGWVFYVPFLVLGTMPWTIAAFRAFRSPSQDRNLKGYLVIWAATVFVFFTISKAKLPHYILPAFPAIAVMVGCDLAARWKTLRWQPLIAASVGVWVFVQGGFTLYYQGGMISNYRLEGPHSELHSILRSVPSEANQVVMYQLPRRQKSLGTGEIKIQETSHPSALLYLNRTAIEAESPDQVPDNAWVVTRVGRVIPQSNRRVQDVVREGRYFRLIRLRPLANQGASK